MGGGQTNQTAGRQTDDLLPAEMVRRSTEAWLTRAVRRRRPSGRPYFDLRSMNDLLDDYGPVRQSGRGRRGCVHRPAFESLEAVGVLGAPPVRHRSRPSVGRKTGERIDVGGMIHVLVEHLGPRGLRGPSPSENEYAHAPILFRTMFDHYQDRRCPDLP